MRKKAKTALITGASSGIGMALAAELAAQNYNLILMARREELLADWAQFLQTEYVNITIKVVVSDVTQFEEHMAQVKEVASAFDTLDLVIANAGVGYNTIESHNTWEGTKEIFDVNLLGAIATIEAAKDFMLAQGYGHIVGISSMTSVRGIPQVSAYSASKAGLTTFLESMRTDLIDSKITVTDVHPGYVATPMTQENGKMPWLVSKEKAAQLIFKAIRRKKARLYFPWQMLFLNYLARILPNPIYDLAMRLLRKKIAAFRKNRN
ncbi:MAG: SDR family NAD(P)-dependent oxidoreductase [bacterium]|nr:SDR family NAD(P)-dependent oxidoreductase [bacterium]MBU1918558.1 SDR family NAD(P)-dependent oxidoreductase [bacterium]